MQHLIRVLLVEDNENDYVIVRDLLSDLSTAEFALEWVATLAAARAALQCREYDVCLVDYRLGKGSGIDLLHEAGAVRFPFILLTGSEDYAVDVAATRAGAADYLVKGHINAPLLERSIRYAISHKQAEERLRESEARLEAAQQIAHLGSWEVGLVGLAGLEDLNACSARWSDEVFRIFGYEPGGVEVSKENFLTAVHPADRARVTEALMVAIREGAPYDIDHAIILPDGGTRWVHEQAEVVYDGVTGQALRMVGTVQDITVRKQAEEVTARLAAIVESSDDAIISKDLNGVILSWNAGAAALYGYSPEEAVGQPIRMLLPSDRPDEVDQFLAAIRRGKHVRHFETVRVRKDGQHIDVSLTISPIRDSSGAVVGASAIARDITARKQTETALRKAHDELEARVEERTALLAESNAALQQEIREREQAERAVRKRARQQEAVAELGQRALAGVDLDTLFDGALALVSATIDGEFSGVLELQEDGGTLSVRAGLGIPEPLLRHATISTGGRSSAGHTLCSGEAVVIEDWASETRFEPASLALELGVASSVHVLIRGKEKPFGVLCVASPHDHGFTSEDIHFLDAVANVLSTAIARKATEDEIHRLNENLRTTNDRLRAEAGERQAALDALRRTAEELEHATQEADRANRSKSEFLSRMSHELRTPLNAIMGYGQLLEMRGCEPRQAQDVEQILKAGRHLLNLINEVLDIARIEAGRLELSSEPVPVADVPREVLALVRPLASPRNIQVLDGLEVPPSGWRVVADRQRLKQVLLNLLSNAIKYNYDGGTVHLCCDLIPGEPFSHAGIECMGWVRFRVRDTGAGLHEAEIAKLFVPFERLGAARTTIEGTGIGLALCKRLVEVMGGRIGVESTVGEGSCFWFELPMAAGPSVEAADRAAQAAGSPPEIRMTCRGTLLYIEDNPSNFNLIEGALAEMAGDLRVLSAMQGSIGLELAREQQPNLILLDVHLPDIMGDVVLQRLRADPATRDIPVVVLSADATPRQRERLLDLGAHAYLTKPVDLKQFFEVVRGILEPGD